ncbi:hypothetical protein [Micromonospora gifhornensis]|uniref:hypothetical protein n=1 Tax=Micromonospora gifhornensis TaxID=84594 RepID=UPI001952C015|nr:hypothetical protein [Micromonospora gifhornensis]
MTVQHGGGGGLPGETKFSGLGRGEQAGKDIHADVTQGGHLVVEPVVAARSRHRAQLAGWRRRNAVQGGSESHVVA